MKRLWNSLYWLYELIWLFAVFVFGFSWKTYETMRVWTIKQKENVISIYQRQIYKELRFFFS